MIHEKLLDIIWKEDNLRIITDQLWLIWFISEKNGFFFKYDKLTEPWDGRTMIKIKSQKVLFKVGTLGTYNMSSEELLKPTWCSDDDCSRDPLSQVI
jgi:hypothetical protein